MTTTIIVEDGTVVSGSNSYVTVSGIGIYATDYNLSAWTATTVTDTIREQAVFKSMRYLEALNWNGTKSTQAQDLEFPRDGLYDRNNYLIASDTIPQAVINAQCEIAVLSLPDAPINLQPNLTKDDYTEEIGIEDATKEKWGDIGAIRPISTAVKDILKGLITSSLNVPVERG